MGRLTDTICAIGQKKILFEIKWDIIRPTPKSWSGLEVWEKEILSPYFFSSGNVTGERYLKFLQIFSFEYLENVSMLRRQLFFFQQDGVPSHFAITVQVLLP